MPYWCGQHWLYAATPSFVGQNLCVCMCVMSAAIVAETSTACGISSCSNGSRLWSTTMPHNKYHGVHSAPIALGQQAAPLHCTCQQSAIVASLPFSAKLHLTFSNNNISTNNNNSNNQYLPCHQYIRFPAHDDTDTRTLRFGT